MTVLDRIEACGCDAASGLIGIDEALARIHAAARPVEGAERVALAAAAGRRLAAPVRALAAMPRFDNAAMDGWALRADALDGPGPWRLPIAMEIAAGAAGVASLPDGAAARIYTGAPLPSGADAVIMQERTVIEEGRVTLLARPRPGENVRRRGEDMAEGATLLEPGLRVDAAAIAAAAAGGHGELAVRRAPRVALVMTGDELQPPGAAPAPGGIWDVNAPMLRAAMLDAGAGVIDVLHVADRPEAMRAALAAAAGSADLIVTSGGVSVGDRDCVRPAVAALGGETAFAGVSIKPGKPVAFGRLGAALWLGLPGNPLAAFACWTLFGRAALDRLSGGPGRGPRRRNAILAGPIRRRPGRCELRPARLLGIDALGREIVDCAAPVASARVTGLPGAVGFAMLPADAGALPAGAMVELAPFRGE